ncbi:MAG TPA: hypothetical protein VHN16_05570 [Streptosporangiaceae bacterium]|nr:hypothetical protein [Streptosporangiaceae bacterium]
MDTAQMPAVIQARALTGLERAAARTTAARAAFTASQGYCQDADHSPRSWLIHQTRVTQGTAADHTGWSRDHGASLIAGCLVAVSSVNDRPVAY